MNKQQTVIPAAELSPVQVLRMEKGPRDPYVFGVQNIRRLDGTEARPPAGVPGEGTPSAAAPSPSLHIYELVNCTV